MGCGREGAFQKKVRVMTVFALIRQRCLSLLPVIPFFSLCVVLTGFHCGEGECEGVYSPFLKGGFTGFGGVKGDDMWPGALTILSDFSIFAARDCGPYSTGRPPSDSCVNVPGGDFCQRLIMGDLCYGDAVIEASEVILLEECISLWGETKGFDLQACTFHGVEIDEGGCDELQMAFDRIQGCLERRGSGAIWESPCITLVLTLTPPLLAECPWWKSDECFEMYLPPP
jgi:hypothetical protein